MADPFKLNTWLKELTSGIRGARVHGADVPEADAVKQRPRAVLVEEVFPREVRDTSTSIHKAIPAGAKGFIFYLQGFDNTGTFEAGEGLSARAAELIQGTTGAGPAVETERRTASVQRHTIYWYPGVSKQDVAVEADNPIAVSGLQVSEQIRLTIAISGTFGAGEGFDCRGFVKWIWG